MLGAIFGDIVGSVYEFHNIKTKQFKLFGIRNSFTDDTVMTVAVARALLQFDAVVKNDDVPTARGREKETDTPWRKNVRLFKTLLISAMHQAGEAYPHAGYGGMFRTWLSEKLTDPYGSYGNGSAMRVSPVAWYANSLEEAIDLAKASAEVTHNHPEGIKGAVVTAGATFLARKGALMEEIQEFVARYYKMDFTLDEIRPTYSFNESCQGTVPQAMQAFFESVSFEDAIRNAVSLGGDSDTLAAVTGAVAEAYYGMSDGEVRAVAERLDPFLLRIAVSFQQKFTAKK